jgi:hypothetical protein
MPDEQIDRAEWTFHPAAQIFPLLDEASPEFKALATDIKAHGLLEPIRTLDGMIIIGRNRYNACLMTGAELWIEPFPDGFNGDPLDLVISSNRHRRHWTQAQLAWIALGLAETSHGDTGRFRADSSKRAQPIDSSQVGIFPTWSKPEMTQADAAKRMSVNIDQIRTAAAVKKAALPEIRAAIENGKIKTINHAYIIVTPDKDEKHDGVTSETSSANGWPTRATSASRASRSVSSEPCRSPTAF